MEEGGRRREGEGEGGAEWCAWTTREAQEGFLHPPARRATAATCRRVRWGEVRWCGEMGEEAQRGQSGADEVDVTSRTRPHLKDPLCPPITS